MTEKSTEETRQETLQDEEDYDLLTYAEAGLRLDEEIADLSERVKTDSTQRARLDALVAAKERNSRRAVNDANFEKFFGYPAKDKGRGVS